MTKEPCLHIQDQVTFFITFLEKKEYFALSETNKTSYKWAHNLFSKIISYMQNIYLKYIYGTLDLINYHLVE